ncbi:MAG: hypothetical protein LBC82_06110 [Oscillospiraceae bacterium]|jgi:hypothetical protein|nr:hypothetical protein [Oscillospiraceae bacterium]
MDYYKDRIGYCPVQDKNYKIKVRFCGINTMGAPSTQYKPILDYCEYAIENKGCSERPCPILKNVKFQDDEPQGVNIMFKKLPKECHELLKTLVNSKSAVGTASELFDNLSSQEDERLRGKFRRLKEEGYIDTVWADNIPYKIIFQNKAYTYEEDEAEYERHFSSAVNNTTNINATNVQMQQNTIGSSQNMSIEQFVDFDKALEIFNHVVQNIDNFNLSNTDKDKLVETVTQAISKAKSKEDGEFIQNALSIVRNFLVGVSGNLAAAGILHMITQIFS